MTSTPNGTARSFALEPLAELGELVDDRVERVLAARGRAGSPGGRRRLGAAGRGDPGGVVEHPDRHPVLLVALDMAHEACDRRVDGEAMSALARELAEPLGPWVVHPEAALEVDLAGLKPRSSRSSTAASRGLSREGSGPGRSEAVAMPARRRDVPSGEPMSSDPFLRSSHGQAPTRIDLLELDIDLRLADLWREAADIDRVEPRGGRRVHARRVRQGVLRRADRGRPGSLCEEHGYRIPAAQRRAADAA